MLTGMRITDMTQGWEAARAAPDTGRCQLVLRPVPRNGSLDSHQGIHGDAPVENCGDNGVDHIPTEAAAGEGEAFGGQGGR